MSELPLVVDGAWLESRLGDPRLRILDATAHLRLPADGSVHLRPGHESYEREHIPGALFADLLGDLADPDAALPFTVPESERFAQRMGQLGVGEGTYVVVYDQFDPALDPEHYQFWAPRLWWHLRLEGFDDVAVLDGGLGVWKAEGRPTTSEPSPGHPPAEFRAGRRPELLADADEVTAGIDDEDVVIINALPPETYAAGRIPRTHNVSFTVLIDPETGRMRSEDDLRRHFDPTGALHRHRRAITYCGGGIAACVGALALARLGRDDVAVYDGSMNDWTSDPARPVERG